MAKHWTTGQNAVFKTIGASSHTDAEREPNDYYATDPKAIDKLLNVEKFTPTVWECACGAGHLVEPLQKYGYKVAASDIVDRGCPGSYITDFLKTKYSACDIITNPPYKFAKEFVVHALEIIETGRKVAMFLKLTFLEGKARYDELFSKLPPRAVYVLSERLQCAKNGEFSKYKSGALAYAWFVWEKGYTGQTTIGWI